MVTGGCLCGEVAFEVEEDFKFFNFCHCRQCRQVTGSAHASNLFTDADNVRWIRGEEKVKRYDVPGRAITSAFCSDCGSNMPYVSAAAPIYVVPAGSLNEPLSAVPVRVQNIFWGERADWYEPAAESERYDAMPDWMTG